MLKSMGPLYTNMAKEIDRGTVVLAPEQFSTGNSARPFIIISDETYPFYPDGYLGLPVTSQDKRNTVEIHEYEQVKVWEELHIQPSFANPYSPTQVNTIHRKLMKLSDEYTELLAAMVCDAVGK
jgi:hypothetical protein